MIHFAVFSGHSGQLTRGGAVYISIFGGATLARPPVAGTLARARREDAEAGSDSSYFFFVLFGSATVRWPTLAEEYVALLDALRSGVLSLEDWDRLVGASDCTGSLRLSSFSLFGGVEGDAVPTEDQELDEISLQQHAGAIPDAALQRLMIGIGQKGASRLASVRQAVAATAV